MSNIFIEQVSIIECEIYYFWRTNPHKEAVDFFSVWVKGDQVVRAPHGKRSTLKGRLAKDVASEMKKEGYQLEIL